MHRSLWGNHAASTTDAKKKARDSTHMHVYTYMLERKFSNIIHEELPTSKQAAHIESVNYTYYTPRISQEKKLLYID
jgi:hypothetical protein